MKQKKIIETELLEKRNKQFNWLFGILTLVLSELAISGILFIQKASEDTWKQALIYGALVYVFLIFLKQREKSTYWYWILALASWGLGILCVFLPPLSWPVSIIFLAWTLFYNSVDGMLVSTMILCAAVMLSGADTKIVLLYIVIGGWVCLLFHQWKNEKKPEWYLICFSFVFLTAQCIFGVLGQPLRVQVEDVLVIFINLVITLICFVVCLRLFLNRVVDKEKNLYATLNEPTCPVLEEFKKSDLKGYMQMVHIAYFCERIANTLMLSTDALKCAAYYEKLQNKAEFPEEVQTIWKELSNQKADFLKKETIVLICSESVIGTILALIDKNGKKADYSSDIEKIFIYLERKNLCMNSDITIREWSLIKKTFLEEKLYYDFLC